MAFIPTDYAHIQPIHRAGLQDLIEGLGKGFQVGTMPARFAEEQKQRHLMNALNQLKLDEEPERFKGAQQAQTAQNALRQAQAQQAQMQMARMKAFSDLLQQRQGASSSQGGGQNVPIPGANEGLQQPVIGQGQAPMRMPEGMDGGGDVLRETMQAPQNMGAQADMSDAQGQLSGSGEMPSPQGQPSSQGVQSFTIPGNPNLARFDEMYKKHPEFQDMFKKQFNIPAPSVHQDPQSGQVFAQRQLPSGAVEVRAIRAGRQPEDIELAKDIAKADAGEYKATNEQIQNLDQLGNNLDFMIDTVNANAGDAAKVIGPWNSALTKYWTGDPKQLELLGQISSSTGNILLEAAKQLKGATTGRQMSAINAVKPNAQDRFPMFVGKLKAMKVLQDFQRQQAALRNRYIRQGFSAADASEKVKNELSFKPIQKRIDGLFNNAKLQIQRQEKFHGQNYSPDVLSTAKKYGISPDEVIKRLQQQGVSGGY